MDSSSATITVKVEKEEDLSGPTVYRANARNEHGDEANGKSTTSPAIATAEAVGNLIDAFH